MYDQNEPFTFTTHNATFKATGTRIRRGRRGGGAGKNEPFNSTTCTEARRPRRYATWTCMAAQDQVVTVTGRSYPFLIACSPVKLLHSVVIFCCRVRFVWIVQKPAGCFALAPSPAPDQTAFQSLAFILPVAQNAARFGQARGRARHHPPPSHLHDRLYRKRSWQSQSVGVAVLQCQPFASPSAL